MSKHDDVVIEYDKHAKSVQETLREVVASPVVARIKRAPVPKVKPSAPKIAPKPKREVMPWEVDEVLAERDRRVQAVNDKWFARYGYRRGAAR